jgi:hypothetical protein
MNSKCFCGGRKWDWQLVCKECWFSLPLELRKKFAVRAREGTLRAITREVFAFLREKKAAA